MNPYLSIVIPAHNEAAILPVTLKCLREFLDERPFTAEVIVVDDGSTDNSSAVLGEWRRSFENLRVLRNSVNLGKGASIRRGILASQGECVFVSDADLPGRPEDIVRLLEALRDGAVVAIASRRPAPFGSAPSTSRFLASTVYRTLVRLILNLPLRDTQCGFKAFLREPLLPIAQELRLGGFSFDVEFLYAAWRRGLAIREVDFQVVERRPTRYAILLQSPRMLIDLLRIRIFSGRATPDARTEGVEIERAPVEAEPASSAPDAPR
jgi:glycosyltransferase involved in cell wall biosynthesis